MDFGLKRSPLAACVLALATCGFVGCPSTPITPPGPVDTDETARLGNDEQLATARALALKGTPSPAPELDLLVELAEAATPELGLEALVGAGGKAPIPTLVPGDAVEIGVFGYESYTGVTQVSPEGEVAITAVGSVKAVGLTTSQLAKAVADYLVDPGPLKERAPVTVRLETPAERSVSVVGRVRAHRVQDGAGLSTSLIPLTPYKPLSVYDLIDRVQGLDTDSAGERLTLIRRDPSAEQGMRCYHFGFQELLKAHLAGRTAWLEADDQLIVPRLPSAHVFGAVVNPGAYPLRDQTTVAALLVAAGGLSPNAGSGILLLQGSKESAADKALVLKPGQVIYVPQNTQRVYIVGGGVANPGPVALDVNGMSALQAIAEAGWFSPTGDPDGVEILRNGRRIPVPVSEILNGQAKDTDYSLRAGDTVLVPESIW
ncbi:MAG: SLBB domain-containing protein [Planctomycetes bacterium]|nr:SLBB domain-containing protein [Planctomycetota bacterium]